MTGKRQQVVGVDFGTSSVRAVIIEANTGREIASGEAGFARWDRGDYCDAAEAQFRQHPAEQIESMVAAVSSAVAADPERGRNVVGICVDTTGSTPCAVDAQGLPLSLGREFADDPDAMSIMWKDHTAVAEAAEITERARKVGRDRAGERDRASERGGEDFLRYCGGEYSAEWFWAKILHVERSNPVVAEHAAGWLEHCDWMPALMCGSQLPVAQIARGACGTGHKALWNPAFGGYPPEEFFGSIDPVLAAIRRRLPAGVVTSDTMVGTLSAAWAGKLGLPQGIAVAAGLFDAHAGALGAGVRPGTVVKVMGTSSAEMIVAPAATIGDHAIAGIESQAHGSMIPGMVGIEAGQSAFGDVYAWFRDLLGWAMTAEAGVVAKTGGGAAGAATGDQDDLMERIIPRLSELAAALPVSERDPVATDWFNGRRAPYANHGVRAAIAGLTLGTTAPQLFKALVEATAFGTRAIHDLLRAERVPIERVVAVGGIPRKAPYVMQTLADVLETPVLVSEAVNGSARGAAIMAAVAAGLHPNTEAAIAAMAAPTSTEYLPRAAHREVYRTRFAAYQALGRFSEG